VTQRIICSTKFDITATGVRSNFNVNRIPITTTQGLLVADQGAWIRARNQQRNWETINQIISLRTLPFNITEPVNREDAWHFSFEVDQISTVSTESDAVGLLNQDSAGVPMIVGLGEISDIGTVLDPGSNINFCLDQ